MNRIVFNLIVNGLVFLGKKTRLSYNEINIIVYYFAIPFSWFLLIDIILNTHYLKLAFVIFTIGFIFGCRNFKEYANWLFEKSVSFLNYFNKYGSNYIKSSVWICVSLPIIIYGILIFLIIK
jgi:hypothetical protein